MAVHLLMIGSSTSIAPKLPINNAKTATELTVELEEKFPPLKWVTHTSMDLYSRLVRTELIQWMV